MIGNQGKYVLKYGNYTILNLVQYVFQSKALLKSYTISSLLEFHNSQCNILYHLYNALIKALNKREGEREV